MTVVAAVAAWLLVGWLSARPLARVLDPEDGGDFAFTLFVIAWGPVGIPGTLWVLISEGEFRIPGSDRVDWSSATRRLLALRD